MFVPPRGVRRGAALTLVFGCVVAVGATTGAFGGELPKSSGTRASSISGTADSVEVAEAAAQAMAEGKSAVAAAEEVVSRSGDRWSAVYSAREYQGFRQALDGEYLGVGLWVRSGAGGRIEVARLQPGSPADRAEIAIGDRILTIDGVRVTGEPVTQVVARLRGEEPAGDRTPAAGTPVVLCLERGDRVWRETLRRTRLSAEPIAIDRFTADHATRIRVESFTKGVGEKVRRAVREAPPGDGILLDLRGNSGGLVSEAVTAASAFLDGGLVATYDVRGEQHALYAREGGDGRRLVVLVDGGTMSAAELLAGALQDRGRAVIVGSRTFGKGSVQMPSELPDGSVAELTVGHYRTPAGRTVDGEGITPDLPVRHGAEKRARRVLSGLGSGS